MKCELVGRYGWWLEQSLRTTPRHLRLGDAAQPFFAAFLPGLHLCDHHNMTIQDWSMHLL